MNRMSPNGHPLNDLDVLRRFDTCTLANAIERFTVRPRNEGFMSGGAICQFPHLPPMVGHAVTGRIQTYMPPMTGKCYYDHIEWWRYLITIPPPRVVGLQSHHWALSGMVCGGAGVIQCGERFAISAAEERLRN